MRLSPTIDFEKLVAEYQENLATVLRGFKPAEEFLESWVHDEDPAMSLINIMESAELAGVRDLLIYIGPRTLQSLELPRLKEMAERIGRVETSPEREGLNFKVSFQKK